MNFSFFSKNNVGLDISDRSIEIAELSGADLIIHKARTELTPGIIERGRIQDQKKLSEITKALFKEAKIGDFSRKALIFGLPESQTFIHVFDFEKKEGDIEETVRNELRAVVPFEFDSVAYGFSVYEQKPDGKLRIAAIAAERGFLAEWKKFLENFGFGKVLVGAETFASYIGLGVKNDLLPVCVVDIGAAITMMSVYDAHGACFASSIERAGGFVAKKTAEASGLSLDKAEKIKRQSGIFDGNKKTAEAAKQVLDDAAQSAAPQDKITDNNKKAITALKIVLRDIILNVKNNLQYCRERRGADVSNIVLIGGTSRMPGVAEFFKEQAGLNVAAGVCPYLSGAADVLYVEAVGLALYNKNKQKFPVLDRGLAEENNEAQKTLDKDNINILAPQEEFAEDQIAEDSGTEAKTKKQKIIFLIIVFIGIAALIAAFSYRAAEDKKHQAEIAAGTENFSFAETLLLAVPVAVDLSEEAKDRAKGRIIIDKIQIVGSKEEAIQTSGTAIIKQLLKNETFWKEPLVALSFDNPVDIAGDKTIINYAIQWLVYDEENINNLFIERASLKMQESGVKYSISNIEKKSVKETENKNIYMLHGAVTVATDRKVDILPEQKEEKVLVPTPAVSAEPIADIDNSSNADANKAASKVGQTAIVQETETGWLNVRKTPDAAALIIKQIYPGEAYEISAEDGDWLQLKLDNEVFGWAAARYLK